MSAGLNVKPTYIPGSALGQYGLKGPITTGGRFNPYQNSITYLAQRPLAARTGILEHELVHAATANIPGLSKDWRYQYLYQTQRASVEGRRPLSVALPALAYGATKKRGLFFDLSEGLADRSGAYPDVPKWGDDIRKAILGR